MTMSIPQRRWTAVLAVLAAVVLVLSGIWLVVRRDSGGTADRCLRPVGWW